MAKAPTPLITEYTLLPTRTGMEHFAISIHRMESPYYEGVKWAVRFMGSCLDSDGLWEFEPTPSSRDDKFYKRARFDSLQQAMTAALAAAAKLTVNCRPVYEIGVTEETTAIEAKLDNKEATNA